ncbi:WRKY DNA-binding domain-containing protein [Haematococcus lacustris]
MQQEHIGGPKTSGKQSVANHDGWQWRKYGEKIVKGSINPRSYYKCSHSGCTAKKIVERTECGDILNTDYKDDSMSAGSGDTYSAYQGSAALFAGNMAAQASMAGCSSGSTYVVEADTMEDGYRWRKYGQKYVKGSPYPRSYYKCTSQDCPVRKHVERSSHGADWLVITYENTHNHAMPQGGGNGAGRTPTRTCG